MSEHDVGHILRFVLFPFPEVVVRVAQSAAAILPKSRCKRGS